MTTDSETGIVYLVGAGPGNPDLITVRGVRLLRTADVVLFDRLIAMELLAEAGAAELIDVGKTPGSHRMPQEEINRLIVAHALAGKTVVRLKGGDPFVFGRGMEELEACRTHGIECEVVPGVSSVHAAPAAAGIPITHRGMARNYTVITGQSREGVLPDYDFAALAKLDTLVVLMGLATLPQIATGLIEAGRSPDTPAAAIASGTTAAQRVVTGTLTTIAETATAAGLESPVITVIGNVAAFAETTHEDAQHPSSAPSNGASNSRLLFGRRVVVTQAESTSTNLQRRLLAQGATVVNVPLIRISYPMPDEATQAALTGLTRNEYDVLAFTSVHGVRGFAHALAASGIAIDSIRHVRVAALGHGTAAEARKLGFHVHIIPPQALADELVVTIDDAIEKPSSNGDVRRVLFPRSNLALVTLREGLSARGFDVIDPIVYETIDSEPTANELAALGAGFDAILFCSPSAVLRFAALDVDVGGAVVGCIGPTTADTAVHCGISVKVVPEQPGTRGMVAALIDHFNAQEALA